MKKRRWEFEEVDVEQFSLNKEKLSIVYGRYNDDTHEFVPGTIQFIGVRDMCIDGQPSDTASMYYPDGEIIHFETEGDHALLLVDWDDYKEKKRVMKSYKFTFTTLESDKN